MSVDYREPVSHLHTSVSMCFCSLMGVCVCEVCR